MSKEGLLFNKYELLDVIGEGGTSRVYLARNVRLGNHWAIKKAFKDKSAISLHAEPNILIKLNHPAIPKIVDIEEDEEAIYIIEEYIEGIHLKDYRLQKEVINEEQIIEWGIQICDILTYLHEIKPHPIIFRDLKPDNIILSKNEKLYIVDFGIAREFKETSNSDTVQIGTRGYAAPEQYGIGQSDVRTDIYSLGVTLYYLVTGRNLASPPYKITSIREYDDSVSGELEEVILKCCDILPSNRYQRAADVKNDLLKLKKVSNHTEVLENPQKNQIIQPKRKSIFSQPKLNIEKTIMIGLCGVAHGVGVTHTALLIANYLSKKDKVAIIEMNNSLHLIDICGVDHEKIDKGSTSSKYKNVDYYFNCSYQSFIANYRDRYKYVIVDFGTYEDLMQLDEFLSTDLRLVVGHGIDWKIKEIVEFNEQTKVFDQYNRFIYLIPFLDQKHIKDVKKLMDNPVYALPYNMNPLVPQKETEKVIKRIIEKR